MRAYGRRYQRALRATEDGKRAHREANRRWEEGQHGRAKLLAAKSAWREKNREKLASRQRELRASEPPEKRRKRIDAGTAYRRHRAARDPKLRMRLSISSRIATALKTRGTSKRSRNWERLVGYTLAELKAHIERQFTGRMSWENYGEWHVDHIVPVAAFGFQSAEDDSFKACWALSNLRPLWAEANRRKKSKRLHLI
jgi:hypothetical protein